MLHTHHGCKDPHKEKVKNTCKINRHGKKEWKFDPNDRMFLVLPDSQGNVDSVQQFFGKQTIGPDGLPADSPVAALAKYDVNHRGVIDSQTPVYADLRLWGDLNCDGMVDDDELFSLTEMRIGEIALTQKHFKRNRPEQFAHSQDSDDDDGPGEDHDKKDGNKCGPNGGFVQHLELGDIQQVGLRFLVDREHGRKELSSGWRGFLLNSPGATHECQHSGKHKVHRVDDDEDPRCKSDDDDQHQKNKGKGHGEHGDDDDDHGDRSRNGGLHDGRD